MSNSESPNAQQDAGEASWEMEMDCNDSEPEVQIPVRHDTSI